MMPRHCNSLQLTATHCNTLQEYEVNDAKTHKGYDLPRLTCQVSHVCDMTHSYV